MKNIYECRICGVVTRARDEVCDPILQSDRDDYCGFTRDRDVMCDSMKEHLTYVCGTCGRPAEQDELVCNPLITANMIPRGKLSPVAVTSQKGRCTHRSAMSLRAGTVKPSRPLPGAVI